MQLAWTSPLGQHPKNERGKVLAGDKISACMAAACFGISSFIGIFVILLDGGVRLGFRPLRFTQNASKRIRRRRRRQ
jgi:hypothetical protein